MTTLIQSQGSPAATRVPAPYCPACGGDSAVPLSALYRYERNLTAQPRPAAYILKCSCGATFTYPPTQSGN